MKSFLYVTCVSWLLLCGCADTNSVTLDHTSRPHTASVDVFKDGATPTGPTKEIAELSWKGHSADELKAEQYLMKEAQKRGGNAILMQKIATGDHLSFGMWGGLGGATRDVEFLFTAKVLVYE